MKKFVFLLLVGLIFLTACAQTTSPSAEVVGAFLRALSDKNSALMLSYVCADYEFDALLEFDAYGLVQTTLSDLDCQQVGTDGEDALVVCSGSIDATYSNEVRNFDLSERTYRVINTGGDWLVCGYTK